MPEFDAGGAGGELPVELALVGVGGVGPGFEFRAASTAQGFGPDED
jgi:hypothetical protein